MTFKTPLSILPHYRGKKSLDLAIALYTLELGNVYWTHSSSYYMRVPGGWIKSETMGSHHSIFIPYSDEFNPFRKWDTNDAFDPIKAGFGRLSDGAMWHTEGKVYTKISEDGTRHFRLGGVGPEFTRNQFNVPIDFPHKEVMRLLECNGFGKKKENEEEDDD